MTELSSSGFGSLWGHTRTYSNQLSENYDFGNGYNWIVKQWAYLTEGEDDQIVFVRSPQDSLWFEPSGGDYVALYGAMQTLTHDALAETFTVASPDGDRWEFHDFTQTTYPQGLLKQYTPVGEQTIEVTGYTADGRIAQVERGATIDGVLLKEAYAYEYFDGELAGCLSLVTLRRRTGDAPWSDVRRVRYSYYSDGDDFGGGGDLRTAVVEAPIGLAWGEVSTNYYRYYHDGYAAGFAHGLKFVLNSAAFHRLERAVGNPFTATDAEAAAYADFYYEYDADQRVVLERVAAGSREYTFAYTPSGNAEGPNSWAHKTVETQPDGTQNIVYTNFLGQVMLKDFQAGADHWLSYRQYGEASDPATMYRLVRQAAPSAVVSYDDTAADLDVVLHSAAGLIYENQYHDGTGGTPLGYPKGNSLKQGSAGSAIKLKEWEWSGNTAGGLTVYNLSQETVYKSAASGGSEPVVTGYAYTYRSGTNQIEQQTKTLPLVPTAQNGSNTSPEQKESYDEFGNMIWEQGPKGFIDNFSYDVATAARTQMIDDVDSTKLAYPSGWTRPGGLPDPLNLITDYANDALGRNEETLGPVHQIDGVAVRQAVWTVRLDVEHETRQARGYATSVGPNYAYTLVNPVSIARRDETAEVRDRINAVRDIVEGRPTAADEFPQSSWVAWSQGCFNARDELITSRSYHTIPGGGNGTTRVDYDETTFAYDLMGRQNRVRSPGGTITRTTFDSRGLPIGTWVGTNDARATDADPTGGGASGNNMVIVSANQYDGGDDGGDGNVTRLTEYVDSDVANDRVTLYGYDFRNRRTTVDGEIDFYEVTTYDNLDRAIKVQRYDTVAPPTGKLIFQNETLYDNRSNVYQRKRYAVNPVTGSVGNVLVDNFWYDAAGNTIKELFAGSDQFTKRSFDGIGRETASYQGYYTEAGTEPYSEVGVVTDDNKIFEETLTTYDGASNPIMIEGYQRFHLSSGNGTLNPPYGSEPRARVGYLANYFDGVGRPIDVANYGTNGSEAFTRSPNVPERSDLVLVTSTAYDAAGRSFGAIDPAGIATRRTYDALGRETSVIQNFTPAATACDDANVRTFLTYTPDGKLASLTAVNPATGDQRTSYHYGTTLADSAIARSDLLNAAVYPDATDVTDRVTYRYNRQADTVRFQDQNGSVHEFDYDKLGRQTADRITTLGGAVDGLVRRIEWNFDVRSLVFNVTSYDAAASGSAVNQVRRTYNDFAQLEFEYQSHGGTVNTSSTPKVQYYYANGSANTVRPQGLVYPGGGGATYSYGSSGEADDRLSRVYGVNSTQYYYLGMNRIVSSNITSPSITWSVVDGGYPDPLGGLDRFGRTIDCRWAPFLEEVRYGYDRASSRIWRQNAVAPDGENDELYGYDRLQRLTRSARGTLAVDKSYVDEMQFAQDWTFDATGNWSRLLQTDANVPAANLDQIRTQNASNEITTIARRYGAAWLAPAYDRAGNSTFFPQPLEPTNSYDAIYDAWNRLVELRDGATVVADYEYDGFNRRTIVDDGVTERHSYYSASWQLLEERLGATPSSAPAERQFIWGLRYIDDLILRDRSPTNNGTLSETLYAVQDANWNVTALLDENGDVVERYRYEAYGKCTILDPEFDPVAGSGYDWEIRYCGYRFDLSSGIYYSRRRYLLAILGRWISRDPAEYTSRPLNLYQYAHCCPTTFIDPWGLQQTTAEVQVASGYDEILIKAALNGPSAIGIGEIEINPNAGVAHAYGDIIGTSPLGVTQVGISTIGDGGYSATIAHGNDILKGTATIENGQLQRAGVAIEAEGTEGRIKRLIAQYGNDSQFPGHNAMIISTQMMGPAGRTGAYGQYVDLCVQDDFAKAYVMTGLMFTWQKTPFEAIQKAYEDRKNPK